MEPRKNSLVASLLGQSDEESNTETSLNASNSPLIRGMTSQISDNNGVVEKNQPMELFDFTPKVIEPDKISLLSETDIDINEPTTKEGTQVSLSTQIERRVTIDQRAPHSDRTIEVVPSTCTFHNNFALGLKMAYCDEPTTPSHPDNDSSETFEASGAPSRVIEVIDKLFGDKCNEQTVLETIHGVIHKGKDLNKLGTDSDGNTALHRAVQKNSLCVAEKLLDYEINPLTQNTCGKIPLKIALENKYDEMAAMIMSKLDKRVVRHLFDDCEPIASGHEKAKPAGSMTKSMPDESNDECKIRYLIKHKLDQTLMQVLDSFMEEREDGHYDVHVKLLDTDDKGREPTNSDFDRTHHTVFQQLAAFEKKDTLNHPVIRGFVEHKWKQWCKRRFLYYFCLYLFSLVSLSYCVVTGVTAPDVHSYDSSLQYSRAVFEVISYLYSAITLCTEIRQMIRHKRDYFVLFYNWLECSSAILLMISLPLRYTITEAHWYTFAVGFFLWTLRIFKYSKVFTNLGLYSEIIRRILVQDFVQFGILFLVINSIFAGTFLLVLKGDGGLRIHNETSSFQGILFVGLRTLIEAAPIVDYTGSDGYRTAGTIVMLIFMFLTIVVLLNILIAQISETYTRVHDDSLKTVRAYRAWIVARSERDEWHLCRNSSRVASYRSTIENVDIKALEKNDASEIEVLSANIAAIKKKQIKDGLEIQTVKNRQWHFNTKLMQEVEEIKNLLKPHGPKKRKYTSKHTYL